MSLLEYRQHPLRAKIYHEYVFIRQIGKGSSGVVFLALKNENVRNIDRDYHVIKVKNIKKSNPEDDERRLLRAYKEIRINQFINCQHQNLLCMHSFEEIEDDQKYSIYILYKYIPNCKDLAKLLKEEENFTLKDCLEIMMDIIDSLNYLHSLHIYHLDVKPSNVLIQKLESTSTRKYRAYLIDYDVSNYIPDNKCYFAGTVKYFSPEMWMIKKEKGKKNICYLSEKTDVYSLGVMFYRLLNRNHLYPLPFRAKTKPEMVIEYGNFIENRIVPNPLNSKYPEIEELEEAIKQMMAYDPDDRPSLSQVRDLTESFYEAELD